MSFLSIAFLAALPLAAAPILLHLFDRRRNVVIEWGAMQFLIEAASRRTSARKLKQWLLLLLRVLAIAALVLALARPMLPGSWLGSNDRGETVFIIDNSMSMMRDADGGPLFAAAIEEAVEQLHAVENGDFVRVLLASPYPTWATDGSLRMDAGSLRIVEDQLRELRAANGSSDLLSALFTAVQTELQPTQRQRRIVLLTDGQGSDWNIGDVSGWKRLCDVLEAAPVPTRLDVIDLDRTRNEPRNVAVNSVHASRMVVGVNQTFTLTARIQNHGRVESAPASATWGIGERALHDSHVPNLDGGAVHDVAWRHSLAEKGVYAVSCRIDTDDDLAADNSATVVVDVVDQVPVLLAESARELAEMQQDAFFVEAALGWLDGEPLDRFGVHVPTVVHPDRLEHLDLETQRAIVVPNLTAFSAETVNRLEEFVSRGGGLWIALGPRTDVDAFNQLLFADGHGLAPLPLDRIVADDESPRGDGNQRQKTAIDPFVKEHPATAGLADSGQLDLGDVTVSRRFRFVPPPDGDAVSALLSLSNGEPLAVEKYLGRGRVIVQAVPLRLQWSELVRSQSFVIIVQDWLDYLTQPRATRRNLEPGEPISVHLADAESQHATLTTPHGDEIELTADAAGAGVVFRSSRTIFPGDYSLELGLSGDKIPFHVNRDARESNLASLTAADRERLSSLSGLSHGPTAEMLSGTNQNEPLWSLLLMVLIGLIAAELLLSGIISRERFGSDPIAETTEQLAASPLSSGATSTTSENIPVGV